MCGEIDYDLFHRVFLCDGRIHNRVQDCHVDTEEISFDGDRRSAFIVERLHDAACSATP